VFAERSRTPTILGGHLTAVCLGHRPIRVNVSSHPAESAAPLAQGLDDASAEQRLRQHGRNELRSRGATPWWTLFVRQLQSPLVLLLIAGAVVSGVLGAIADAVAILAIVSVNAVVGYVQERRAERAMGSIRSLTARRAVVVREGRARRIPAAEVVPEDLMMLEAGDVVAADAQLLRANDLRVDEAVLTGESAAVRKSTEATSVDAPVADRHDRVFMGTTVTRGSGFARVRETGMRTEMGSIARALDEAETSETPLQRRLAGIGRILLYICLALVAVVAALGLARGESWDTVLISSVSLAVAAVPEGLPAIVTIALALGMQRMAKRSVLIRRLPCVETLGSVTTICTDKTGTLTTGRMRVREMRADDEHALLEAAAGCCNAELGEREDADVGDPTEIAILRAAAREGIHRVEIEAHRPRIEETPFETSKRWMSVFRDDGTLYLKGAPEVVTDFCERGTEGVLEANERLASRGLRVIAVATGSQREPKGMRMVGLLGLADPPRPEAREAIAAARGAGVRVLMVTGDQVQTAHAIARELDLVPDGADPEEHVHARVTPGDKSSLVERLQSRGEIVAMTGDGVNDAPAIAKADIGIAMGAGATEVTRENADMVLTDDDLSNVVVAIHEGRAIYRNIRKTVVYLLSGNFSELLLVLLAAVMGMPIPLLPLHLLWINLLTEPLPAIGLVLEPASRDLLREPPRPPAEALLGRRQWTRVLVLAAWQCTVALAIYTWALEQGSVEYARSMTFSTLVFADLLRALGSRHARENLWQTPLSRNPRLLLILIVSLALQALLFGFQPCREIFHLVPLSASDFALCLGAGLLPLAGLEVAKLVSNRLRRGESTAGS
jgi:Ca2+-transporting ATPase